MTLVIVVIFVRIRKDSIVVSRILAHALTSISERLNTHFARQEAQGFGFCIIELLKLLQGITQDLPILLSKAFVL